MKLPGCLGLGLQRIEATRSYLAIQYWESKAAREAAISSQAYPEWFSAYEPTLTRNGTRLRGLRRSGSARMYWSVVNDSLSSAMKNQLPRSYPPRCTSNRKKRAVPSLRGFEPLRSAQKCLLNRLKSWPIRLCRLFAPSLGNEGGARYHYRRQRLPLGLARSLNHAGPQVICSAGEARRRTPLLPWQSLFEPGAQPGRSRGRGIRNECIRHQSDHFFAG